MLVIRQVPNRCAIISLLGYKNICISNVKIMFELVFVIFWTQLYDNFFRDAYIGSVIGTYKLVWMNSTNLSLRFNYTFKNI